MKAESEAAQLIKKFITLQERETSENVQIYRTDDEGEFTSQELQSYLRSPGFIHQTSIPHTSAMNGKGEGTNGIIEEEITALLAEASLPSYFWTEAMRHATHLIQRTTGSFEPAMTRFEVWTDAPGAGDVPCV